MNSFLAILVSQSIKATLILLAAYLVTLAMRQASASTRRSVWVVAAVCILALPVLSVVLPSIHISRGLEQLPWTTAAAPVAATGTSITVTAAAARPLPWILIVWALGMLAVAARWTAGTLRMWWLSRSARCIAVPELDLEQTIGVAGVEYLESARIAMPMTWGILNPLVFLPENRASWPAERLRMVIAHELVHVRQRDCLAQLLMQLACALYWFHPLAWFAAAQFLKERERACDDGVLNLGVAGPEYAGHLLELMRSLNRGTGPAMAVAMAHPSNIENRLVALLDSKINRKTFGWKGALVMTLAAACLLLPLASVRAQTPTGTGTITGTVYDASRAVVPRATVVATRLDGTNKEEAVSGPAGQFTLRSIPAGKYLIEVSAAGFRVFQQRDVVLKANDTANVDALLDLGRMSERIEVSAERPAGAAQPSAPAGAPRRIKVGGNVMPAKLVSKVSPIYPEYAKAQGIEGPVLLRAIISKDGSVMSLNLLNTPNPDLAQAATNAVQQWHYEPTLLNGEPVEVETTVTVFFTLK